jgi:hypothetical protein
MGFSVFTDNSVGTMLGLLEHCPMKKSKTALRKATAPDCLDVVSWRIATTEELRAFMKADKKIIASRSELAVRRHLSPVDMYCYLRGRFGEPNGFANFLRQDDSDNLIHWDFNLRAGVEDVYIYGTSREIHFVMSTKLTDENWSDLIRGIRADYQRVAQQKSEVFKSLEPWAIFPNRYVSVSSVCADLHAQITDNMAGFARLQTPSQTTKKKLREHYTALRNLTERASILQGNCLQLSLLTPILAEAFINMLVLMLCKPEIRANERQFDAFIRSHIDTKIFDLAYKCNGFLKPIDRQSESFKKFHTVMNKRNHTIHGNCNPEREQIELVYFEGKRPLFRTAGDHIGTFLENLERQYAPAAVIKDYEDTQEFLADLVQHLEPTLVPSAWAILEDPYPGYHIARRKTGHLFPDHIVMTNLQGLKYDDDLNC